MDRTTSSRNQIGCKQCDEVPTYLTPRGLRCREHIHHEDEWDDWIPLVRKSTAHRPPARGTAGTQVTVSTGANGRS